MEVASYIGIVVICYLIGMLVKLTPIIDNAIPVICGLAGAIIGVACFMLGLPDFPADNIIMAIAVGITSGLSATGINQAYKQIKKAGDGT